MAQRVADYDVKMLIDTELDTQPFIDTATLLVDEILGASGHSAARLTQIELYLAAHFCAVSHPLLTQVRADQDTYTYHLPEAGDGFKATSYGRQALVLDTTGTLAQLGMARKAHFTVF